MRPYLLYSSGAFGFNVLHQTLSLWLVYFFAPPPDSGRTAIVPLAVLGVLLTIGRVLDAVDDPLIGHWSDTTRSRWGRRFPFVAFGTPVLMLAFVLIWQAPAAMPWAAVYAFVVLQLYSVFSTIVHQPYEAALAEITREPAGRMRISAFKVTFGVAGAAVGLIGSGVVIDRFGFEGMGALFAVLAGASIFGGALGMRRLPAVPERVRGLSPWEGLRLTATNGQFLVFVCSEVSFYLGLNMLTALVPYFVTVILRRPMSDVSFFTAGFFVMVLVSLPVVQGIARRWGKAFAYRLAMGLLVVLLPGLFFAGTLPGIDPLLQGMAYIALLGVPMSAIFVLPNPMIADIVDYDETRTRQRREGVYYGVEETLAKAGTALAAVIFSVVLGTFGYSAEQPLGVRLIGPVAGLLVLAGLLVFTFGYRLPDRVPPPEPDAEATPPA